MTRQLLRAAWAPLAVVIGHAVIALVFGHQRQFDPAMHFFGGVAGAYFASRAVFVARNWFGNPAPTAHALIAFCLTATAAVCWEFEEFTSGLIFGHSSQHSVEETMGDLLLGCGGALIFVLGELLVRSFRTPANR
jgi:hypothetical protein